MSFVSTIYGDILASKSQCSRFLPCSARSAKPPRSSESHYLRKMSPSSRAEQLRKELSLLSHPEGGYYSEIYRSEMKVALEVSGGTTRHLLRSAMTSIYFLLTKGDVSRWHVVEADEAWHFYEGDAIELYIMPPDFSRVEKIMLGTFDADKNVQPVHVVPAGWWQASRSSGEYSLCGCTVAPGFEFAGFRMLNEEEKVVVREKFVELEFLV